MAKTNKEAIIKLCSEINRKEGKGTVYSLGGDGEVLNVPRWSTGIEDLDAIIGGGMPEGRIVEIWGAEGSGKTTLAYHLCGRHDLCLDVPIEGTFDAGRARIFGNRPKQMLVYRARYGEDAFNKCIQFTRLGIPLIVVDSVPSMLPRADFDKILKSANNNTIEEQSPGPVARVFNKYLPVVEDIAEMTGTTLVFINQLRDNVGAVMMADKTKRPGGHKLKHAESLSIQVARKAWIEVPNKNPCNTAANEKVGFIIKCKVVKSKVCNPLGECEIPCFFDRGFVSFDDIDSVRKEIMETNRKKYIKRK